MNGVTFEKEPKADKSLKDEQWFIYRYGLYNCKILKFKSAAQVLRITKDYKQKLTLGKKLTQFIVDNADKEVLCYLCYGWSDEPDVFVYGDDNIPFQTDCFV